MSSQEGELRYSYTFRLPAKGEKVVKEEQSKTDVQAYVNDLLGVKPKSN